MQPSNPRLETSSNKSQQPSGADGASSTGNGKAPETQQSPLARVSPNERRAQAQKQQQQEEPRRLSLAELFSKDENGEDVYNDNGDTVDIDPSKPPESMDDLSKRLGFKPEQIYNVKIPLADGAEPLTIGQMKDRVGELVDLETREAQFEQHRVRAEGELLRAQTEVRNLLAMIPKEQIRPEIVNKLRQQHDENMVRERRLTMENIPQWKDEQRRAEDLQGMIEFMREYAFEDSFLSTVHDHRAIKFIRDMYLRDKRIKAALAKVTTPEQNGQRTSSKTKKPPARPNQQQSPRRAPAPDQRSRIAAFFNQSE